MIDVYSDDEELLIVKMHGVMKSFYHQMLLLAKNEPDKINTDDPVWHLAYTKPDHRLTSYHDKVIDTIKRSCTFDKYGLTYHDLMQMDIATFDEIRTIILETDKALSAGNQAITNSISDLTNNKPIK